MAVKEKVRPDLKRCPFTGVEPDYEEWWTVSNEPGANKDPTNPDFIIYATIATENLSFSGPRDKIVAFWNTRMDNA